MTWPTNPRVDDTAFTKIVWGPEASSRPVLEPVRQFRGVGTEIIIANSGALNTVRSEDNLAVIVRLHEEPAETSWIMSLVEKGGAEIKLGVTTSGQIVYGEAESPIGSARIAFGRHWYFIAVDHQRLYIFDFTANEWITPEAGESVSYKDLSGLNMEKVLFGAGNGETGNDLSFDIAAAAHWSNQFIAGQAKELVTAETLRDWSGIENKPDALWLFEQPNITSKLVDLTAGGANQTSREGTEIAVEPPPIPYGSIEPVREKEVEVVEGAGHPPPNVGQIIPRGGT